MKTGTAPGADRSIQTAFLHACAQEGSNVRLYLLSGVRLEGQLTGFDQFTILLEQNGLHQQVEKSAIAYVEKMPSSASA